MIKFKQEVEDLVESAMMELHLHADRIKDAIPDNLNTNITGTCQKLLEKQEEALVDLVSTLQEYVFDLHKKVESMPDAITECEKIQQKLDVVPKWAEDVVRAVRRVEGWYPKIESMNADVETLKTDVAQCWIRGGSHARSIRQKESAASTGSWEQIRMEAPAGRKGNQQGSQQPRVSMLPESILQSGPMTQRGPGFNVTMGTRNDDEGDGLSGGHGRRMVNINMFAPQQASR